MAAELLIATWFSLQNQSFTSVPAQLNTILDVSRWYESGCRSGCSVSLIDCIPISQRQLLLRLLVLSWKWKPKTGLILHVEKEKELGRRDRLMWCSTNVITQSLNTSVFFFSFTVSLEKRSSFSENATSAVLMVWTVELQIWWNA